MSTLTHDLLLAATSPGGATCLTSVTELTPAAGQHAAIAPAKFASRDRDKKAGAYAYEKRYLDGHDGPQQAVVVASKQDQLNRCEEALAHAIEDGHPTLSRMPRVTVAYTSGDRTETYGDLTLPHRVFDAHIRAGYVAGVPVTDTDTYRGIRDSRASNARALFDASPISLVLGSWDSSRATRQGRWRSALVGEIIGFCADDQPALKGGARTDPVGMRIELGQEAMKTVVGAQRGELSANLFNKVTKEAAKLTSGKRASASSLGFGGIPPTLDTLAGVACHRIIRSHVLSFAALRQLRFGAGVGGDAACRALLAALALNALARSDSELVLRANCDLREAAPTQVEIDGRGGESVHLEPLTIAEADELLDSALAHAEQLADVRWDGVVLEVEGNPAILAGAADDTDGTEG